MRKRINGVRKKESDVIKRKGVVRKRISMKKRISGVIKR